MDRPAALRLAIAPLALTVMVALTGCGDTDDASSDTTGEATTTAAPSTTVPTTVLPTSSSAAPTTTATTEPPATASTAAPPTDGSVPTTSTHDGPVIQLTVGDEVSRHTVAVGDNVLLVIAGDATDEVHVHGYDLLGELRPDQPATITFVADIPGVFEIELEGAHQLLAELEVR